MKTTHNEAPASVTFKCTSPNGLEVLYTVRGESGGQLVEELTEIDNTLTQKGFTPVVYKRGGGSSSKQDKEYREEPCPKCKGRVEIKEVKLKDGTTKTVHECENRKWDWKTKQVTGTCDYQEWIEDNSFSGGEKPNGDKPSQAQEKILKAKGLWTDDLTETEANELLVGLKG